MLSSYFHITLKTRVLRLGAVKWLPLRPSLFAPRWGACWAGGALAEAWASRESGIGKNPPQKRTVPTPVLLLKALGGPLEQACQLCAALVGHPGTLPLRCPFQPPGTHWGVSWVVTLAEAVGRGGPASWEERRHQGTSQWTSWLTPPLTFYMEGNKPRPGRPLAQGHLACDGRVRAGTPVFERPGFS